MKKVYSVLVAEDDENSAKVVIHCLDKYNFDMTHVNDGMAALSKVKLNTYDLIISDIMMPYLDGLAFLEKASEFTKNTPSIILTAAGERKNVLRAAQQQVNHYLLKPIDIDGLIEKVLQCLKLEKMDLVEKKDYPFRIKISDAGNNIIKLDLEGCPKKNAGEEIGQRVLDFIETHSTAVSLEVWIDPVFFMEARRFKTLDDFIYKVYKNSKLRTSNICILSDEITKLLPEKEKFPNLMSCKMESKP